MSRIVVPNLHLHWIFVAEQKFLIANTTDSYFPIGYFLLIIIFFVDWKNFFQSAESSEV